MSSMHEKTITGYHLLLILAHMDGNKGAEELAILHEYRQNCRTEGVNFEYETERIAKLPPDEYALHFNDAMNRYYMVSTKEERNQILDLATRLVVSDKDLSPKENLFLKELYFAWEEETEE